MTGWIVAATAILLAVAMTALYLTELNRSVKAEAELISLKFQLMFDKESK